MSSTTSDRMLPASRIATGVGVPMCIGVLLYFYVWGFINPCLLCYRRFPLFLTTRDFLVEHLLRPGGPAEYLSHFLRQSCCDRWVGSAVIVAGLALVGLTAHGLLKAVGRTRLHPVWGMAPVVGLLLLYGRYEDPTQIAIALSAALVSGIVYVRSRLRSAPARLALFLVLSGFVFYVAGGYVALLAVVCGLFELLHERRFILGALVVLCGVLLPWGVATCSGGETGIGAAYAPLLPLEQHAPGPYPELDPAFGTVEVSTPQGIIQLALIAFFPIAVVVRAALGKTRWGPDESGPALIAQTGISALLPGWTWWSCAGFLAASALLVWLSFDLPSRRQLQVAHDAALGNWQGVLRAARRLPADYYDEYVMHDVNLALYHTRRLPFDMFSYPQRRGAPGIRLAPRETSARGYAKFAEFALELGHVNFAQMWAYQGIEMTGPDPACLKVLVRANVLRGRPMVADTFLGALQQHLLYRNWARGYRDRAVGREPHHPGGLLPDDETVKRIRPLMVSIDRGYGALGGISIEHMLQDALASNGHNRMAFEYLMALYLLARRVDRVIEHLDRLDNFRFERLPRAYEEAIVLHCGTHPDRKFNLHGWSIDPATEERFREFRRDYLRFREAEGEARKQARLKLARKWGSSYFYYGAFGCSEPRPGWRMTRGGGKETTP